MAYTFQTLKSNVRGLIGDPDSYIYTNDAFFTAQCNLILQEKVEFIQQTKPDFPTTIATISFATSDDSENLPADFQGKLSFIRDPETKSNYRWGQIYEEGVNINIYDLFLYYNGTNWILRRRSDLEARDYEYGYTPKYSDLASNATTDLTWLPAVARALIETCVANLLLASQARRSPKLEFRENSLDGDLNMWLHSQSGPRFVTYRGR